MKYISIFLLLLFSTITMANVDSIPAGRNCDVALNMEHNYIDKNLETLQNVFNERGYSSTYKEIGHEDFPLIPEFMITAGDERVGFKVEAEVSLHHFEVANEGSTIIYRKERRGRSARSAFKKAISGLPFCVLSEDASY